jgi:predicted NUDIX family NTP pyrophosphohydrolase
LSNDRSKRREGARSTPRSAGILLYRVGEEGVSVMLAHPGGPFFQRKDAGAWSIPKGLINADEPPQEAARREFEEEVGWRPEGELHPLGEVRLKSGKRVIAFALRTQEHPAQLYERFSPGVFTMEWPRGSGQLVELPEVDRIEFFAIDAAREKLNPAQQPLLDRLLELVGH